MVKQNITGIPAIGTVPLTVLCQTREAKAEMRGLCLERCEEDRRGGRMEE